MPNLAKVHRGERNQSKSNIIKFKPPLFSRMGGATYRVCGSRPTNSLGKFTFVYLNSYDKEKNHNNMITYFL